MGAAEIISFEEVRARKQWDTLRQALHTRFDEWLDRLEIQLPGAAPTLAQVTETMWNLRQALTGGLTETIVEHTQRGEYTRQQTSCAQCGRLLTAHAHVARTVETMVGALQLERPYFYCRVCRDGVYPLDDALGLVAGCQQLDMQHAAAQVVTEVPYDTAQVLFSRSDRGAVWTCIGVSSKHRCATTTMGPSHAESIVCAQALARRR